MATVRSSVGIAKRAYVTHAGTPTATVATLRLMRLMNGAGQEDSNPAPAIGTESKNLQCECELRT